ncbi:MAG TPA: FxLYD domain-containing protein [Nitrososphaeraceae archaeon]|nr:FxLYD domain-containing protein [Nitrososphaeraceae archaeon]
MILNGPRLVQNALAQQEKKQQQQQYQKFVFQKTSSHLDENNIIHVYGLVKNTSNKAFKNIVVKASFYDSNGQMINEFQRSSDLRTINPGETSPFEILYIDTKTVNDVKNYTLSASGEEAQTKARALRILSNNSKLDTILGVYYIRGRVLNEGSEGTTNSMIIAPLYDKNGDVILVGRAQTEPVNISSHSEAAFDLPVTAAPQIFRVKSYSLLADSDQYVTIPEFPLLTSSLFYFIPSVPVLMLLLMLSAVVAIARIKNR